MKQIIMGDNLEVLGKLPDKFARLIYVDPPFNLGKPQQRTRIKTRVVKDGEVGDRVGFGGKEYISEVQETSNIYYEDKFDNFEEFLMPRIEASLHCLTDDGSVFIHLDDRESAYIQVAVDKLLGRKCYMGQVVWAWDWGFRSKTKWSRKHNILNWWSLNPKNYVFNYDAMDRIPYMSDKGLVSEEKLKRGKTPTSCWFHTIIGTNSKEKLDGGSYPSAKPIGIIDRLVKVHSNPNDVILDYFAGSGTTGASAEKNGRNYVLIDSNPDAVKIMHARLPTAQCIGF